MLYYFTINTIAELVCFLVALVCLLKAPEFEWKMMIVFLFITCVAELMGIHVKRHYLEDPVHNTPNVWIYNVLLIFQTGFINLMFYYLFNKYRNSRPIIMNGSAMLTLAGMFSVLYLYELFSHGIFKYNNITNTVVSVVFVLYSLYYYYLLITDEEHVRLTFSPAFWWVAGVLFFYFGRTACNLFYLKLSAIVITPKHFLTYYIYNALNIILYSCWTYSFICKRWLQTTSKA